MRARPRPRTLERDADAQRAPTRVRRCACSALASSGCCSKNSLGSRDRRTSMATAVRPRDPNPRSRARVRLCCARAVDPPPSVLTCVRVLESHPASNQSGRLAHRLLENRALCAAAHGADRRRGGRLRRRLQWATVSRSRTGKAAACADKAARGDDDDTACWTGGGARFWNPTAAVSSCS